MPHLFICLTDQDLRTLVITPRNIHYRLPIPCTLVILPRINRTSQAATPLHNCFSKQRALLANSACEDKGVDTAV